MDESEFLDYLIEKCAKNRITLTFSCQKDSSYTGYFDHTERELVVWVGRSRKLWLPDLIHEMCHLDQFLEDLPLFWKCGEYGLVEDEKHWERYDQTTLKKALNLYRDLEYDCEKRAVKFIRQNDFDIDLEFYCQNANACLYYYSLITDGWKSSPANYPDLIAIMPTTLKPCKRVPPHIKKLFESYNLV